MKIVKVADLESILGKEATARLTSGIAEAKKKPARPPKKYDVEVLSTVVYKLAVEAKNEDAARKFAEDMLLEQPDDIEVADATIRSRIVHHVAKSAPLVLDMVALRNAVAPAKTKKTRKK